MEIAAVVAGALLLLFGRSVFWLFVGVIGFAAGVEAAGWFLEGKPGWIFLLVGLAAGAFGALLAVIIQRLAVAVAGFLAGGYIAFSLLVSLHQGPGTYDWLIIAAGGIAGAVLLSLFFDWALIFLSSLAGAILITGRLRPGVPPWASLVSALFIIGAVIQSWFKLRRRRG